MRSTPGPHQGRCHHAGRGHGHVILQVITDRRRRGAQVFACDLERALRQRGHDIRTVALASSDGDHSLDVPVLGESRLGPGTLRRLRSEMGDAEVVVAHGSSTLAATAIAGVGLPNPVVYRQISDLEYWAGAPTRRIRVRRYLARMATIVTLWDGGVEVLRRSFGVPASKIEVIPNAAPGDRFWPASPSERAAARRRLGLPESAPVVAYLGALVPEKGVDVAVAAIAGIPGAVLLVAGDGPERADLEARAAADLPGRARFVGWMQHPLDVYHSADAVVLPSRGGDQMPALLIEAALCGLPSVATPVQAIGQMIEDGVTGRLVARPEPEIVSDALRAVLTSPAMGEAARKKALATYEIEPVASQWEDALRSLTS